MARIRHPVAKEDEVKAQRESALIKPVVRYNEFNDAYDVNDKFVPASGLEDIHTTPELVEAMLEHKEIGIDARCLAYHPTKGLRNVRMGREQFLASFKSNARRKFRESIDAFGTDMDFTGARAGVVGDPDYIPILGGPFYKQLYYYDYIRMHSTAFNYYNHNPVAKRIVHITRDFTLGREWRLDLGEDHEAQALWDAFVKVNRYYEMMDYAAREISIYGEIMEWWLPGGQTKIAYRVMPGQEPPVGLIPRVRLVDPSNFWEIVTYPEDVSRVLFYQWLAPTQYQVFSGKDAGKQVPITKFIFQQIPANQIHHYKLNSVSNEKRGRSDLFSVLGYLKRLHDSVNYSIIALQKTSAWCIDTEIDGDQKSIDLYVQDQKDMGAIPPAGSEFVHTTKIKRNYLSNAASSGSTQSPAFEWCLSMISIGSGIPIQYLGSHVGGQSTRASAMVGTEPFTKNCETRQNIYKQIIETDAERLFKTMLGRVPKKLEAIFPELITQDRSAKMKDLTLAETNQWLSRKRAATIAAKELSIRDYDYEQEQADITAEGGPLVAPLSFPGQYMSGQDDDTKQPSSITSKDKRALDLGRGA